MSQIAVELIVAAFGDEHGAENVLKTLEEAKKERALGIYDSAVIRRDADNVLHIRETADWSAGKGAAAGALIGGVIGLLFPPGVLATSLLGATIGALAVRLREKGFSDAGLEELGATLVPGTSAIIAIVAHTAADDLEYQLKARGASVVRQVITTDITTQLELHAEMMPTVTTNGRAVSAAVAASPTTAVEPDTGILTTMEQNTSTEIVSPEKNSPQEKSDDPAAIARNPDDIA